MLGTVMLEKEPRPWRFKADEDFLLFFGTSVIVAVTEGKSTKRGSIKRMSKGFLGFFRQDGKVEPAPVHNGLPLDKSQFFMQPPFLLAR
jgi:hypothetical protein